MVRQQFLRAREVVALDIAGPGGADGLGKGDVGGWACDDLHRCFLGIARQPVDRGVDKHGAAEIVQRNGKHGNIDCLQRHDERDEPQGRVDQFRIGVDREHCHEADDEAEAETRDRYPDQPLGQPAIDQTDAEIARRKAQHDQGDREVERDESSIDAARDAGEVSRGVGGCHGRKIVGEDPCGKAGPVRLQHAEPHDESQDDSTDRQGPVVHRQTVEEPAPEAAQGPGMQGM